MAKVPSVIGLLLCERLDVDPATGTVSAVGIVQALRFPSFPTPPPLLTAYAGLYGGEGEGTIEWAIQQMATEKDIHRYQRWVTFPDPSLILNLEIRLRKCVFPAAGRYSFFLRFDGQDIARRFLDVYSTRVEP
jgi:hypothetical protein